MSFLRKQETSGAYRTDLLISVFKGKTTEHLLLLRGIGEVRIVLKWEVAGYGHGG